jgi:poly-gamma-glutamate synthesis protein (capsule biosynthesis protein)
MANNIVDLLICGDTVLINRAEELCLDKNTSLISKEMMRHFNNADIVMANLEAPIIEDGKAIKKCGPNLSIKPKCIHQINKIGIDVFNLANNHIMDYGSSGLNSTTNILSSNNISFYGAGSNEKDASTLLIKTINKVKIAFFGMAEHEFSIATEDTPGANGLSIINYIECLQKNKDQFDFLIVTIHGGAERHPYPTPNIQKICRFLAKNQADVIVCQHQHRPGAFETIGDSVIVYGQGNFIFDPSEAKEEWWHDSLLIKVSLGKKGHSIEHSFIPGTQFKNSAIFEKPSTQDENRILSEFDFRSSEIKNSKNTSLKWNEFCASSEYNYISRLLGHSRVLRIINRFTKFTKFTLRGHKLTMIRNVIETESHREAVLDILKKNK